MKHAKDGGTRAPYERALAASTAAARGWQPQYVFSPRLVGHLARGEVAVEPVLGEVRVAEVRQTERAGSGDGDAFVHVCWRDAHGPGTAAGRYAAERSFLVQMPALADRLLIKRGIDQAVWYGREVSDDIAVARRSG